MTAPQPWPITRLCPATSNLPTRMLASTWQALCAAMQRREAVGATRTSGLDAGTLRTISAARFPCATCQGRTLPPGLELITQQEAEQMARQTKRGICELCGAHTNVGMNHGSAACPACTHVQTALNKRPEAVAKAIRAMGKTEELLSHLIPAGGLAVKVTADLLQEISGIVGYDGEDPAELVEAVRGAIATKKATALDCGDCDLAGCFNELAELVDQRGASAGQLVEAVRRRVLTCASCDSEDVLHEIREIVGYTPEQGDKGLADAVRALVANGGAECTNEEIRLRDDLARACDIGEDCSHRWGSVAQGAIQEIARLTNRKGFWIEAATELKAKVVELNELIGIGEAKLILAEQSRDEWEQRAVQAESYVETLEAELKEAETRNGKLQYQLAGYAPEPCASTTYLLDIALRALRGEGPDADQLATLLDAARRAA